MGLLHFLYSQLVFTPAYPTTPCTGQTIIVTGAKSGLGKEAARHFARLGASKLILAVRNVKAGEEAKHDIQETTRCNPDVVEVWPLDLASYASIKSFAERVSKLPRVDVVLENAGIATSKWEIVQGFERTIAINSSAKELGIRPRLTFVSTEVHAWAKFPEWKEPNVLDALIDRSKGTFAERYPTSKLVQILVARAIAPELGDTGVILKFFFARTTEMGSRTLVASALAGPESCGRYMHNGEVDNYALSPFVKSEDGQKTAGKIWEELRTVLESIDPSVINNISSL